MDLVDWRRVDSRAAVARQIVIDPEASTQTYLLTFCCYGTHLPGDERGWIERQRAGQRGGFREPERALHRFAREQMLESPYTLDDESAQTVLNAIQEVCVARAWQLLATHVRTNHVHCVVGGLAQPNRAIGDFKAYASRALNQMEGYRKRWSRHGSTRRLMDSAAIESAVRYVADGQGAPMAIYVWHRNE